MKKYYFLFWIFFLDKIWLCTIQKWHLRHLGVKKIRIGTGGYEKTFRFAKNHGFLRNGSLLNVFSYPPVPMRIFFAPRCRRCHFWIVHNHTLSRKKSRTKNIIFSWRNIAFSFSIWMHFLEICQVLILFRARLHMSPANCFVAFPLRNAGSVRWNVFELRTKLWAESPAVRHLV